MASKPMPTHPPSRLHPLKEARLRRGMSLRDVYAQSLDIAQREARRGTPDAKEFQLRPSTVKNIEDGSQYPTLHRLKTLVEIYELETNSLIDVLIAYGARHPASRNGRVKGH